MDAVLKIVKVIALLSVTFLCVAVGREAIYLRVVTTQASVMLAKVAVELDALHVVTQGIDRTIKELDYPILQVGITSKKEADLLDVWNGEITHTLGDLDAAVVTVNASTAAVSIQAVATMREVSSTVAHVNPTLDESAAVLRSSRVTLGDVDKLLNDPDITKTLANTQTATKHMSDITADVQSAVHAYLHPGWKTRLFNWSMSAVHAIGGWF